jgi:hypothetical protein
MIDRRQFFHIAGAIGTSLITGNLGSLLNAKAVAAQTKPDEKLDADLDMALKATPGSYNKLSLFNPYGKATAYIVEDLTIYLWSGEPVAYLREDDDESFHVYGFNGKHLGWFVGGAVYEHNGKAVGAVKEAFREPLDYVPFKDFRQYKPFKDFKEYAPIRPKLENVWSNIPFIRFLMQGVSD